MFHRFWGIAFTLMPLFMSLNIVNAQVSPVDEIVPSPQSVKTGVFGPVGVRSEPFLIDDGLSSPRPKDAKESPAVQAETAESETAEGLESELQRLLTGARFKGQFTMDGKPLSELQDETYEIRKVQKLRPNGDTWAIHARIKYGEHDVVVPVPIRIKWAGTTPVLTMDKMAVPGLGTFSARVVLHENRYAGTWQHDEVGGHLFGVILTSDIQENSSPEAAKQNEQ